MTKEVYTDCGWLPFALSASKPADDAFCSTGTLLSKANNMCVANTNLYKQVTSSSCSNGLKYDLETGSCIIDSDYFECGGGTTLKDDKCVRNGTAGTGAGQGDPPVTAPGPAPGPAPATAPATVPAPASDEHFCTVNGTRVTGHDWGCGRDKAFGPNSGGTTNIGCYGEDKTKNNIYCVDCSINDSDPLCGQ